MEISIILQQLLAVPTPSGFENDAFELYEAMLGDLVDEVVKDAHENIICYKYAQHPQMAKTVMLAAHADEIGMMVRFIDEGGYLRFSKIGGVDTTLLKGRSVVVRHGNKNVNGVIGALPVHMRDNGITTDLDISNLWIDIGTKSKPESEALVEVGDVVYLTSEFRVLNNAIVSSRACDNKAGMAALVKMLYLLKDIVCECNVVVAATSQEEVGGLGALSSALTVHPDIFIAVDVAHATDYPTVNRAKYGDIKIGEGVIIPTGTDFSNGIQRLLKTLATENSISYQPSAVPESSGTDAHSTQMLRSSCQVGLLSIPCRYMHSPVEIVSCDDIDTTAELLYVFCKSIH